MPKLSMWKPEKGQDYNFFDSRVREMFTIGGTGVNIHKFLGADTANNDGTDPSQPNYATQSEQNIQDLLLNIESSQILINIIIIIQYYD